MHKQEIIESAQFSELQQILKQYNNTYVIGPNGCGKTTAVHYCLKQLAIPFRRINLMQCLTKVSLLCAVSNELSALWNIALVPTSKFSELIIRISNLVYEHNAKTKRGYIIIDAPQFPQIEFIYLKKLFSLAEIRSKNYSINFIFICNQLPNIIEMPLGVTFLFQYLEEKLQVCVIFQQIMFEAIKLEDFSVQNIHEIRTMAFETAKDVVVTFSIFTSNLHILISIALGLFENFVYKCTTLQQQEQEAIKIQYKMAKKLLMENPYIQINSKELHNLIEKEYYTRQSKDNKKLQAERRTAAQTLEVSKIKLPKMASLILLSSYYASRNPEKTDPIIFRDMKKNKRSKVKEQLRVKQKVSLYRLVAIVQSLMSINEFKDFTIEKQYFNQSVQFYQQIQQLVDLGFIKAHHKKDDILNKVKFECQITEKQAYELAETLNIQFNEFLSKQ